jgi:GNAT superfamily N-acetyltransferase
MKLARAAPLTTSWSTLIVSESCSRSPTRPSGAGRRGRSHVGRLAPAAAVRGPAQRHLRRAPQPHLLEPRAGPTRPQPARVRSVDHLAGLTLRPAGGSRGVRPDGSWGRPRTTRRRAPVGEIGLVGVMPQGRGRGLGRELLRWGVTQLRARGAGRIKLSVEAENELALGLYRRIGFEPLVEWPHWTCPIAARRPWAVARSMKRSV